MKSKPISVLGTAMRPESADESQQEISGMLCRMEHVAAEVMRACMNADGSPNPHRMRAELHYHRVQMLSNVLAEVANDLAIAHINSWMGTDRKYRDKRRAQRVSMKVRG